MNAYLFYNKWSKIADIYRYSHIDDIKDINITDPKHAEFAKIIEDMIEDAKVTWPLDDNCKTLFTAE